MTFLQVASPKFGQFTNIVELHLFGLNGRASHPDMQKIRIKWNFLKISYNATLKLGCYSFKYVPASKHLEYVCSEREAFNVVI